MARKTRKKRNRKTYLLWVGGVVLMLILLFPALHVGVTRWWNPHTSPMQWERAWQAQRAGETWDPAPMRWNRLEEVPRPLIHYIWASEDQRFFQHGGFDLPQLQRAIEDARERGRTVRGASTISMQCARSVYLWQGRSYVRKALEAYYTLWMEALLDKRRILELYLNHIELGPGIFGVGAAARAHFGKDLRQLTDREMLALAAIMPNPRNWSPVNPDAVVERKIRRVKRLASRAPFPGKELERRE